MLQNGKTLDSVVTVSFNNCGKLNGKSINMKLIYSDIVTKGNSPLLYWTAYGSSMASNNEWWYKLIEHVTVKIYFYYSNSNTPINLNTGYLSIFSEDPEEGASSKTSSDRYLYEKTRMKYSASVPSQYVSRTYKNVLYGTGETMDSTEAGTLECVSFQYKNTNNIEVELYALNTKTDVGYHFQYDSLTASKPTNPQKTVDKTVANTNDTLTYTVTQNISKALDKNFYYKSLVFKDVLNSNLSYISLNVYDENNRDVTATAGTTTFESSSRTLKYTFSANYLKNMTYKGQNYKFIIKAKINTNTTTGTITNTSSTIINNSSNYTLTSNAISTKINYKVVVHYLDPKGKKLADSETIMGYENDKYITEAKNFYGYELVATPQNSKGQMKENTTVVTYRYKLKDTNVNVKYVDEKGKEIADTETIKGKVFEKYTTSSKNIYGYQLIETPQNSKGTMTEDSITVIYRYRLKDTNVTVKHENEQGKEIADTETIKGKVFDQYITLAKSIYGYRLVDKPKNFTGTMTENPINVIYRYGLKDTNVIVKYVNQEGNEITDNINMKGKVFDQYVTSEKRIYGYELIEIPRNSKGTMTEDTITVIYPYKLKDSNVIARYENEEGNEIAPDDTVKGKVFDQYTTPVKNIYGYELIEMPENSTGTMTEDTITVTYRYRLKDTNVTVKHENEEGKEIADTEIINGKVFEPYSTSEKGIYGYELIEIPENAKGTMVEDTITVTYRYKLKDTNVNVKYVDEDGKEIEGTQIIEGKVFEPYITSEKNIYGYELIEIPENAKGTMTEDTIIVTYHYKLKETNVNVKYIDEEGKEIVNSEIIEGKVFDQYVTSEKNINGYELIEIPENAKGTMSEDIITVTYQYRKLEFNIAVSQELTKITLNNESKHISKKLEIDRNTNVNSFKVAYTITVSNPSELEGSTVLYNDIPNGYVALQQDNLGWIINDNIAYRNVENLSIGETRDFTIILTATSSDIMGIVVNKVYCMDSTCEPKFEETTLVDNIDTKDFIISIKTGLTKHITEIIFVILFILTIITIMLLIARKNKKL